MPATLIKSAPSRLKVPLLVKVPKIPEAVEYSVEPDATSISPEIKALLSKVPVKILTSFVTASAKVIVFAPALTSV